jgi:hypothetical protein
METLPGPWHVTVAVHVRAKEGRGTATAAAASAPPSPDANCKKKKKDFLTPRADCLATGAKSSDSLALGPVDDTYVTT